MSTSATPVWAPGREENVREINGSTPRVKVTARSLSRSQPIPARLFRDSWTRMLRLQLLELKKLELWRTAFLEAIITGMWVFGSILIFNSTPLWGSSLPGRTALVVSFLHTMMYSIYLLALATKRSSQGILFPVHINPAMTFMLMLQGVRGPAYAFLTMTTQCVGAILAALSAKEIVPHDRREATLLGGCFTKRTILVNGTPTVVGFSNHQGFLAEFMFAFTALYVSSLLTNPRQIRLVDMRLVAFVIAANGGFNLYLSGALRSGYSGSMFNPARCLGSAVAYGQPLWDRLWVPFFAPFVSAAAVAFVDTTAPSYHVEVYAEKRDVFSKIRRSITGRADLEPAQPTNENNTIYEVPSAARRLAESPQTPGLRPPPATSHQV